MERDLTESSFDLSGIYTDRLRYGEERKSASAEEGRIIDLERYRILKTIRTILNGG